MSIPDRLWRVVKGHWAMRGERDHEIDYAAIEEDTQALRAQASAYEELAEVLRAPAPPPGSVATPTSGGAAAGTSRAGGSIGAGYDPLQASYELLGVRPGARLEEIDAALDTRLAAIRPEQHPAGSPQRAALEAQRSALTAAYDRLRDALNPTETRFERLEF